MVGFWNCQEPINGYQVTTLHQSIRRPLLRYAFSCFYYVDTVALCLLLKPTTITFQPLRNIKDFRHGFFFYYLSIHSISVVSYLYMHYRHCRMIVKEERNWTSSNMKLYDTFLDSVCSLVFYAKSVMLGIKICLCSWIFLFWWVLIFMKSMMLGFVFYSLSRVHI